MIFTTALLLTSLSLDIQPILAKGPAPKSFEFRLGNKSIEIIGRSMGYTDTALGTVVASPSKTAPDYYFHWTRDAALVMNVFVRMQENRPDPEMDKYIWNWISLEKFHQRFRTESGKIARSRLGDRFKDLAAQNDIEWDLGEPKFHVDLFPFDGGWGRPQNDGPALRALTMIRFANYLLRNQRDAEAKKLYDGLFPSRSPIKVDLEFIAKAWQVPCFDLWEETDGYHFYTRLVQYRALKEGAKLARTMNDGGAADWYEKQAGALKNEIETHWDAERGLIIPTFADENKSSVKAKPSAIDAAVILASLHARGSDEKDEFFGPRDPRVLKTALAIEKAFDEAFAINENRDASIGTAIGRYPEDKYDGVETTTQGHAWYLTTAAMAELYFLAGQNEKAETFLKTIEKYSDAETLSLTEQFDRHTGKPRGARELTWSAAAYLTAIIAKNHPEVR